MHSNNPNLNLKDYISDIPDYPIKGVIFRDITPLLQEYCVLNYAIEAMTEAHRNTGIETVVALEARGFLFGPTIALELGAGFVPIRKAGKLPRETLKVQAELEYGLEEIEFVRLEVDIRAEGVHQEMVTQAAGDAHDIVDDLLGSLAHGDAIEGKFGESLRIPVDFGF